MLTEQEIASADAEMKLLLKSAEDNRRERPSVSPGPLPGVMDYAQSGSVMELAMQHMRESIPSGQRLRTRHSFMAMKEAMRQHELWLRARGYL